VGHRSGYCPETVHGDHARGVEKTPAQTAQPQAKDAGGKQSTLEHHPARAELRDVAGQPAGDPVHRRIPTRATLAVRSRVSRKIPKDLSRMK
jgi:hypothetical protein